MTATNTTNRLLSLLPECEYRRLGGAAERVELSPDEVLFETGGAVGSVYFPEGAVVSLLSSVLGRTPLEVALVGNEGVVGLPALLGDASSCHMAVVQVGGPALKISASALKSECEHEAAVGRLFNLYANTLLNHVSQASACHRFHLLGERLARWLLMARDRAGSDELHLTHERAAELLGVRREAVTKAAGRLQQEGVISYSRGSIRILDRQGLERRACDCYELIRTGHEGRLH